VDTSSWRIITTVVFYATSAFGYYYIGPLVDRGPTLFAGVLALLGGPIGLLLMGQWESEALKVFFFLSALVALPLLFAAAGKLMPWSLIASAVMWIVFGVYSALSWAILDL
jgi:hypothetical protein